jgi:rare lipoprotein A
MQQKSRNLMRARAIATIAVAWMAAAGLSVASMLAMAGPNDESSIAPSRPATAPPDRSGRKQVGTASFYATRYAGKTMADGTQMHLYSNSAASLTLPLGSTAKVTNLETGRSAVVTIRDRGPYIKGRVIDLSPATAHRIGLERRQGLARVEITPLTVPMGDGTVKVFVSESRLAEAG